MLPGRILERVFNRFPRLIEEMSKLVQRYLNKEKDKSKAIVDSILEMEINELFTNDAEYMSTYTYVPKKEEKKQNDPLAPVNQPLNTKEVFVKEIRNRIEAYFKLIVRNLRDVIPKLIGYNLVQGIQENMQMELYNDLYNDKQIIRTLDEPEGIMRQRVELTRQIKVMKDAQKVIKRDPDLMAAMSIDMSDNDITETHSSSQIYSPPSMTNTSQAPSQPAQPVAPAKAPVTQVKKLDMGDIFKK